MNAAHHIATASSLTVSVLRGGRGLYASAPRSAPPEQPLELYEFEACPYCRKVREVMTELDLEYVSRASARGSAHRAGLDKEQFPFLVDPNTGVEMYESEDITDYLLETYGEGRSTLSRMLAPLNTATAALATVTRPMGRKVVGAGRSTQPAETLQLFSFEASPYCRLVRETLCELDLDCHVRNVGRRSARRPELVARGGTMMVPYLIDPNTDTEMYESADIIAYLRRTYAPGGA